MYLIYLKFNLHYLVFYLNVYEYKWCTLKLILFNSRKKNRNYQFNLNIVLFLLHKNAIRLSQEIIILLSFLKIIFNASFNSFFMLVIFIRMLLSLQEMLAAGYSDQCFILNTIRYFLSLSRACDFEALRLLFAAERLSLAHDENEQYVQSRSREREKVRRSRKIGTL